MPLTKSGFSVLLTALLLLPSLATTLNVEKEKNIVRRASIDISSHAEFSLKSHKISKDEPELGCDGCSEKDFVVGVEKSNSCRSGKDPSETLVNDAAKCRYAAERNGAHTEPDHIFKITEMKWVKLHPHGCFHAKCTPHGETVEKDCYFLNQGARQNSNESEPLFAGTPICERKRFVDGGTDVQDGCPDEFTVVNNETLCEELCGVFDEQCNEYFRIGNDNYTRHFDFPKGCFHLNNSGGMTINGTHSMTRVYYNPLKTAGVKPVKGTTMCEVTSPLDWASNPPSADSGNSHVDTAEATATKEAADAAAAAATTAAP